jgi:bacteriorhodopsin
VPNCFVIRRRLARTHALLLALAFAASTGRLAHAATLSIEPGCTASGDSLKCHLLGLLNFLYAAAGVLAFMLIVVVVLAVKSYRKNKDDKKVGS